MISRRFEKNVLWQVLTVQVINITDKFLINDGEKFYFLKNGYNITLLTKDELYDSVFERLKNNERVKETGSFEGLFRDSYTGVNKHNNIFNVVYDVLAKTIQMKSNLESWDNDYRQKMSILMENKKLSTEKLVKRLKDLTDSYESKQYIYDELKEIYDRLIFCGSGVTGGVGYVSDEYKEIYVWLKDLILLSYQLNNLTDVEDDNVFALFRVGNWEEWIPRTFSGRNLIQTRETIKESLVLSVGDVLFIPCYLDDKETATERFLETIRLKEGFLFFSRLFSEQIKKNWFVEDFDFKDLEDATHFYRAMNDKLM